MSLEEIKSTPRYELEGLLRAMAIFNKIQKFEGYTPKDVNQMAKDNSSVRSEYNEHLQLKEKYERLIGRKVNKKATSLNEVLGQL